MSLIVKYQFRFLLGIAVALCIPKISLLAQPTPPTIPFTYGEELLFLVSYGWIDLADAKLKVHPRAIQENSKTFYKIDAFGTTKGAATLFGRVNDNWGTHMDTNTLLPSLSYRYLEEGGYRKNEKVHFDQVNKKAIMELYDRENKVIKEVKEYKLSSQVQDLVSGFYYLRTMDLSKLRKGQEVRITGFFDKKIYNLKLIFEGNETLQTSLGTKETYIFSPQLPKNSLFRGEYPVKVWITKDANKIPVKIKADLFIGSLNIDITSAKGLKNN
ncbi:MAG: DUF3108 domain-containing protein [Bacteroidota bacterium]|nr:DUF3108 domain-containing protein [Algoriphagus sp.]